MLTPVKDEILGLSNPSQDARRFRTVLRTFEHNLDLLLKGTGLQGTIDHPALAQAFANWRQVFDEWKYLADINRNDFIIYAAGLMLRELFDAKPLTVSRVGEGERGQPGQEIDQRMLRWPEGYVYTSFCLAFAATIVGQYGCELPAAAEETGLARFWDTFRENTRENPSTAVAFFDFICGQQPNWDAPDVPYLRPGLKGVLEPLLQAKGEST